MFSDSSGFLNTATLGLSVGMGLEGNGILFNPARPVPVSSSYIPTKGACSLAISAVVNSLHTFTMSLQNAWLWGWNRKVRVNGSSAPLVELKFYRDAGNTDLQYQTLSGGISAVGSFYDRAGFPIDTDSGTIYGTLKVFSGGGVNSDTINVQAEWEV
jgi:hypothetical protein